jgi:hypothetical protein
MWHGIPKPRIEQLVKYQNVPVPGEEKARRKGDWMADPGSHRILS